MSNKFRILGRRVPIQEKINFSRHLAITSKTGIPIVESLRLIRKQTTSKTFQKIIDDLIKDISNGRFLAQGLERHHDVFGDFFINIVRIGEMSGTLSNNLLYLSQELKKQKEINSKVRSALIYPIIILFATLGISLGLTLFIFPKILPIFISLKIPLPLTTRLLIKTLEFSRNYGHYALGGAVVLIIALKRLIAFQKVHFLLDKAMLSLPIFSRMISNLALLNFARSLSILLKSGMTLVDALSITQDSIHNLCYRQEVNSIIDGVKRGEQIATHLARNTKLFPATFVSMIQVGESTGNLEENLNYLAEYFESEIDEGVKNLTSVLEPILLIVMGLLVGFIAISIITPIYKVTQGLRPA